jgi:hypothetical protein
MSVFYSILLNPNWKKESSQKPLEPNFREDFRPTLLTYKHTLFLFVFSTVNQEKSHFFPNKKRADKNFTSLPVP